MANQNILEPTERASRGCASVSGSATGTATSERESLEPWILEAARELAMDSAHIPAIAGIIKRHAPKPNAKLCGLRGDEKGTQ